MQHHQGVGGSSGGSSGRATCGSSNSSAGANLCLRPPVTFQAGLGGRGPLPAAPMSREQLEPFLAALAALQAEQRGRSGSGEGSSEGSDSSSLDNLSCEVQPPTTPRISLESLQSLQQQPPLTHQLRPRHGHVTDGSPEEGRLHCTRSEEGRLHLPGSEDGNRFYSPRTEEVRTHYSHRLEEVRLHPGKRGLRRATWCSASVTQRPFTDPLADTEATQHTDLGAMGAALASRLAEGTTKSTVDSSVSGAEVQKAAGWRSQVLSASKTSSNLKSVLQEPSSRISTHLGNHASLHSTVS